MIIREVHPRDKDHIKNNLRPSSLEDMKKSGKGSSREDIWKVFGIDRTVKSWTIEDSMGKCAAIVGVHQDLTDKNKGFVWLVGSKIIDTEKIGFLRATRKIMPLLHEAGPWDIVWTYAYADSPHSFNWMTRWLGFEYVRTIEVYFEPFITLYEVRHKIGTKSKTS